MSINAQNLADRARAAGKQIEEYIDTNVNKDLPIITSANINVNALKDSVNGAIDEFIGATANPDTEVSDIAAESETRAQQRKDLIRYLEDAISANPKPNSLRDFASYNYIFTLGVLTNFEVNFPDLTYRKRDPWITVLRSGGGLGNSKATTIYEKQGRIEYFIDDVVIDSIVGLNPKTKQSNATRIDFKVNEPYSMGLFLQTMQVAAAQAGYSNYLEAPFLLAVDFVGWDDEGRQIKKPNLRRIFPFMLAGVDFQVTEGGSLYEVAAIPWAEQALNDSVQTVKTDINLSGRTVAELLQSGGASLAENLNNREQEKKKEKQVKSPDEYVILFPKNRSSLDEGLLGSPEDIAGATKEDGSERELSQEEKIEIFESITGLENATLPADFDSELAKLAGTVVKRSNIGESIREFAENKENINDIGTAPLVESFLDGGKKPFGRPAFVEETRVTGGGPPPQRTVVGTGVFKRGNITISDNGRVLTFKSGTKVQDIIEEIILLSDYGRKIVEAEPDKNGMIPWFRIQTDVYNITDHEQMAQTGTFPKVYVFRVMPYKAHISRTSSTTKASPGLDNLKKEVIKKYDYIYTGENDDVLNFNIKFDTAFFSAITPFGGRDSAGNKNEDEDAAGDKKKSETYVVADGDSTGAVNGNATSKELTKAESGKIGGGNLSNAKTQIARNFNDALVNSPVDLVTADMTIWGDPYYVTDSGFGNYTARPTNYINITEDGTMDYQSSEVDIEVNFRTPLDYNPNGSYMDFPGGGTKTVGQFSGLYQVIMCLNEFSQGIFTQQLKLIRRRNQPGLDTNAEAVDVGNQLMQTKSETDEVTTDTGGTSANGSTANGGTTTTTTKSTSSTTTRTSKTTSTSTQTVTESGGGVTVRTRSSAQNNRKLSPEVEKRIAAKRAKRNGRNDYLDDFPG